MQLTLDLGKRNCRLGKMRKTIAVSGKLVPPAAYGLFRFEEAQKLHSDGSLSKHRLRDMREALLDVGVIAKRLDERRAHREFELYASRNQASAMRDKPCRGFFLKILGP